MNFFGHAVIASRMHSGPAFVLGSMVPDFATMSRDRLQRPDELDAELDAGVAMHHLTDRVFHVTEDFVRFNHWMTRALQERDVRRGTAMAVGHIGAELLLDRAFVHDGEGKDYVKAIALGAASGRGVAHLRSADGRTRYHALLQRLEAYGTNGYDVPTIAERLQRALAGRKRLEVLEPDKNAILVVLEDYAPQIAERRHAWSEQIEAGLAASPDRHAVFAALEHAALEQAKAGE
ncbi:MAG: hypothetical protein AAF645_22875 [Myxococcota bacterium]